MESTSSGMALDTPPLPARRPNLAASVQSAIAEAIRSGQFKIGEFLPTEHALSIMYGVSRPTVREALVRLRAKSPYLSRSGHRTRVDRHPDLDRSALTFQDISCIEDFKRCYEFRRNIEAGAARHAALNRDDEDLDKIWQAFDRLHGHALDEMPVDADFTFHVAIASASRNPLFLTVLESIRNQTLFTMDLSRKFSRPQQLQRMRAVEEEHRRVVSAIADSKPDAADAAMRFHIDQSTARVLGK
ncbi:FadR/GntR family transcriptional regulator [Noviherbaspirillum album]|nr:FadR/GntR family transcriptional regulator [Noviherbaspirillum sp. CPCC 100848]